jgi:pimeloyl-ACP methyl ester carboxylesterase
MREKVKWRDPALGRRGELELPHGRLRYFEAGVGEPIVFVHGYLVNANIWRKVIPRLARDFRCIALDLPFGSHELPMKPDADLSGPGQVNLVLDAIDALGLDQVTLVGMDTGGAICQFIVTQQPDRVRRLVLTSCDYRDNFPPRIFSYLKLLPALSPLVPLLMAPVRLRAMRRLPHILGRLSKWPVDGPAEDTYVLPALDDRRVRADVGKAMAVFDKARLNQAADNLWKFERPALIAWSREDKCFPLDHAKRLARELPNARLEWIEGARTFSMEDQPEHLARAIAGFLHESQEAPLTTRA